MVGANIIISSNLRLAETNHLTAVDFTEEFPEAIFLASDGLKLDVDLILSNSLPYRQTMKLLEMACYRRILKSEKTERAKMHDTSFQYLNKLADISISLSSEDDLLTLLRKILEEGQNIACCDAAYRQTKVSYRCAAVYQSQECPFVEGYR